MHYIARFIFVHSLCVVYLCDSPFWLFDAKGGGGGSINCIYFLHSYWFGPSDALQFVIQCFISYCVLSVCIVDVDRRLLHFQLTGVSIVRTVQIVRSAFLYLQFYLFSIEIINIYRASKQKCVLHITTPGYCLFPNLNMDINITDSKYKFFLLLLLLLQRTLLYDFCSLHRLFKYIISILMSRLFARRDQYLAYHSFVNYIILNQFILQII